MVVTRGNEMLKDGAKVQVAEQKKKESSPTPTATDQSKKESKP